MIVGLQLVPLLRLAGARCSVASSEPFRRVHPTQLDTLHCVTGRQWHGKRSSVCLRTALEITPQTPSIYLCTLEKCNHICPVVIGSLRNQQGKPQDSHVSFDTTLAYRQGAWSSRSRSRSSLGEGGANLIMGSPLLL